MSKPQNILGLDVGEARVGVARANSLARLPEPLTILPNDEQLFSQIKKLVDNYDIQIVVVGLPRNMAGEETAQSTAIRAFTQQLKNEIDKPVVFADETLSTKQAEASRYVRDIDQRKHLDDIAACFILEEYLRSN